MLPHAELEAGLQALPAPPRSEGRVELVVLRLPGERRLSPATLRLEPGRGAVGDRWSASERPNPEAEVTLMRHDVASLLCEGPDTAILGDNLFVHLDTSGANLPAGTRLRVGGALCEVTPKPHTGCNKFSARVGPDALAITRDPAWKAQNLRGVHLRVLEAGDVSPGDAIVVLSRP